MVAFVIFWASALTMLFFVLNVLFKALASAFNALLSSLAGIVAIGGLAALAVLALFLLYAVIDKIVTQGIGSAILAIFLLLVGIGAAGAIFGGLGTMLLSIVVYIAAGFFTAISFVLEGAAAICETGYAKFLSIIQERIDRC